MAKTGRGKEKNAAKAMADAAGEQAKKAQEQSLVLIPAKTLKQLLSDDDGYKQRIDGMTGELREQIKYAADKKHLHKGAYALLKKLHRIDSAEQLRTLWLTLLAYMDMAGVMKRIDSVPDLPLGGDADADAGADDPADETGVVEAEDGEREAAEVVTPQFGSRGRGRRAEPTAH